MINPHNTPRIAFSVTNCICRDQRVMKMAAVLQDIGATVIIIGRWKGECCEKNNIPYKTKRFRMIFKRGFLFYKFFNIRLFFWLLFKRFDALVANDLDTLLPNYLVAKIKNIPLVYDSHEYFTGVLEVQNRRFVKWVWKTIEKSIFPRLENVMTVSDSISGQYFQEYGVRPVVVRNCSKSSGYINPVPRTEMGIDPGNLLLILQGTGINIDRGGMELIGAAGMCDNISLIVVGSGDLVPLMKEEVAGKSLAGKVIFFPEMDWEEMMKYTKAADAGVSLDKNTNINHSFSLPNKVFDYISAAIPVIAGDLPEVTKIVTDHTCGIIIPEVTPGEISQAVNLLNSNRDLLRLLGQNAKEAAEILNWEKESEKVYEFYKKILSRV